MKIRLDTILGGVMVLAFLLPWVSVMGFIKLSGFDIAWSGWKNMLFFLIPALAIAVIISSQKTDGFNKNLLIGAGAVPWIFLVLGWLFNDADEMGIGLFDILSIGAYLSLIAGVLLILLGLGKIENKTFNSPS